MVHPPGRSTPGPVRRLLALAAGVLLAGLPLVGTVGPARADGPSSPDDEHYLSRVTGIQPALPGLDARVAPDGRITLSTSGREPVVVLGYAGEDYLRIGPGGAQENTASLSSAINAGPIPQQLTVDATANAARQPAHWVKRGDVPSFSWRDYRVRWTDQEPPRIVREAPRSQHTVLNWGLPLRSGNTSVLVLGEVRWTGAPWLDTGQTVALVMLLVLIALASGLVLLRRLRRQRLRRTDRDTSDRRSRVEEGASRC